MSGRVGFFLMFPQGFVCYPAFTQGAPTSIAGEMFVPQRRLDDRLRALCLRAKTAPNGELVFILQELLALVHRKTERLKRRAGRLLLKGEELEPERRNPSK
jgi:hypothetical protein